MKPTLRGGSWMYMEIQWQHSPVITVSRNKALLCFDINNESRLSEWWLSRWMAHRPPRNSPPIPWKYCSLCIQHSCWSSGMEHHPPFGRRPHISGAHAKTFYPRNAASNSLLGDHTRDPWWFLPGSEPWCKDSTATTCSALYELSTTDGALQRRYEAGDS